MKVKDPVCGMEMDPQAAATTRDHMGQTFYFCSTQCADTFDEDPHKFAHQAMQMTDTKAMAGSATTGFNPDLSLTQVDLPVVGLKKGGGRALTAFMQRIPGVSTTAVNAKN
ncbi:MAG: YHS domain-containing protein, partial [Anaerolineae bacterium]